MNRLSWLVVLGALVAVGCRDNKVQKVTPTLGLESLNVDFGPVRVDTASDKPFVLSAMNGAAVQLTSVTVEGDAAFSLDLPPELVPGSSSETLTLKFAPKSAGDVTATLVVTSDDELAPERRVELTGRGAYPKLTVEVACDAGARCEAVVANSPPSIDFAPEPFVRLRPIEPSTLPQLRLRSTGEVPVVLSGLSLGGTDVGAFSFVGNAAIPDGGLVLPPMMEASVPVQFRPTSDAQPQYAGEVLVASDDPTALSLRVPLTGRLRPNFPPRVCANVARVSPIGAAPRDYDTPTAWAEVIAADGGVDLRMTRDVPPRAEVVLSALSSMDDETACTSDPEDGRLGLTWSWRLTQQPMGSTPVSLTNPSTPRATLRPAATGLYVAELSVMDSQGNVGTTTVTFEVAVKNDLVVQVDWSGDAGGAVDVDLHLVRPGASAFSPFASAGGGLISGDMNGYSATSRPDGGSFDWGFMGTFDDPRLNFDDTGSGVLLENVSLNGPEGDDACATGACTYRVYVHGFRDGRSTTGAASCFVDGGTSCLDGEACGCATGLACVANVAPVGSAASGAGKCLPTVSPTVRVFLRGSATPAISVPLTLGAPCQMLHAADIAWPARGTDAGVVVTAGTQPITRYGIRAGGGLQCAPDGPQAGVPWYSAQPR